MHYVTDTFFSLGYTISPSNAANNVQAQYHVEIHNVTTGSKKNKVADAFYPAVAPTLLAPGTTGVVGFYGLNCPNDGTYVLSIYYSDNPDLDVASMFKLVSTSVRKVTSTTAIDI